MKALYNLSAFLQMHFSKQKNIIWLDYVQTMVSYSHLQARLCTRVQVLKVQKEGRKYCEFLILIHILIKHFPLHPLAIKKWKGGPNIICGNCVSVPCLTESSESGTLTRQDITSFRLNELNTDWLIITVYINIVFICMLMRLGSNWLNPGNACHSWFSSAIWTFNYQKVRS